MKSAGAVLVAAALGFTPVSAIAAQPFELAISGYTTVCYYPTGWYYQPVAWFTPDSFMSAPAMDTIASADGQTVFGIPHDAPGNGVQIVQIAPDGSQTVFFDGLAGYFPTNRPIVVARTGRVFLNVFQAGDTTASIATISPAGTFERIYPGVSAMAVGADGCTLFVPTVNGIGRMNGCTGASLPDFLATRPTGMMAFQVTGSGDVIIAFYQSVALYDGAGNFVRTLVDLKALGYNSDEYGVDQIALSPDGQWVWVALGGCSKSPVFLVASLRDGSVFRSPLSDRSYASTMNFVTGMVVGMPASAPALGPVALALLGVALAAVGAAIIKTR